MRAPRGSEISCKGWQQEAALRMLMNNLDPEVAEHPEDLVVYGGTGRAARSWAAFDAIVATLRTLEDDETMLVQSGKPVGVFRTHEWSPRVLIANSNLVGDWANWEKFRELEAAGLTMYGQMTAGSWIYIGTQGILQGTYETFGAVARKRFGGTLAGTITLTAGLGGMGGAQPLAVTMNDGVAICVDCDPTRIERRIEQRYLDTSADTIDDALRAGGRGAGCQAAVVDRAAGQRRRGVPRAARPRRPDRHRHRSDLGARPVVVPAGRRRARGHEEDGRQGPGVLHRAGAGVDGQARRGDGGLQDKGAEVFDYGNSIRDEARKAGYDRAFDFPGFVPAYIRPQFEEGLGPFRWAALSGDPKDIEATDRAVLELFPDNDHLRRWITHGRGEGQPTRVCPRGSAGSDTASGTAPGCASTKWWPRASCPHPIVIGRDHLDSGSVASPYRETEAMLDGSDAIADWPLLNALVNTASGASWVSIHHGGGVGMGRSIHAGQVCVADGHRLAAQKLERVLTNDPGMGVIRHVDAGYEYATQRSPPSAACGSRCRNSDHDVRRHLWDSISRRRSRCSARWLSPIRWTTADLTLREWFAGEASERSA